MLPNGEKELILSFVEEHVKSKARCGDLTKDKAKNLVILLRGPSGVGKTLVAEAMAEKLHMPLIKINPDHSDRSWLRDEGSAKVINNTWNAILLLEESESFVQDKETIKSLKETKILNGMNPILLPTPKTPLLLTFPPHPQHSSPTSEPAAASSSSPPTAPNPSTPLSNPAST